ncbi:hypothetical protein R5W23_003721 [Gemmata sp. JC673]|uniref:SMI1/KNR4 family protein n=1 Tax=Gemmata algarum TaxID=2975278 RepID=A0ABU5F8R3_9BACT|nr:hypothetical protein [Gemmata algarum]MDY3562259.1 hypothetical protein [Gemmata algarum]
MVPEDEDEWVGVDRDCPQDADEWHACTDIDVLYWPLRNAVLGERVADRSPRKWVLFAAGCCRQVGQFLIAPESWAAVEAAEAFADGLLSAGELAAAAAAAVMPWRRLYDPTRTDYAHPPQMHVAIAVTRLALDAPEDDAPVGSDQAYSHVVDALAAATGNDPADGDRWRGRVRGSRLAADLFRCVMGNPYRTVAFAPEWRTATTVALARHMYETRDFSALPILADALQDAGCDDAAVLTHCRGLGPHARGCWVLDWVLGYGEPYTFSE